MSERKRHSVSEELLFRYFIEEVSPDEQETVLSWKAMSEANYAEFERVRVFLLDVKALRSIGGDHASYDVLKAWEKVQRRKPVASMSQKSITWNWMKIAVTILLVAGAGWFAYLFSQVETQTTVAVAETQGVELADGSNVTLNKGSELIYPDRFKENQRNVVLKGEAYFEITKDPDQPFVIQTDEIQVTVLGTSFNVNNANADSVIVSVDTGRVLMSVGGKEEILTPGFRGVYYRSSQTLVKVAIDHVGMHNYWRTKKLSFRGATVAQAVRTIQEVYEVKVEYSNPDIAYCKINVDFENEPVENVLDIMAETLNLVWSNQGHAYLLAGYGCPQ
ncbi:FecR domain-containing protein [Reichenbachiella carrageenanivorans]|uniref:FecR domain-containing protein n=1 Tax=Reichenbachiella carrageenanivorans TaxID=2979869 RepID=A0ABY6CZD4_9BACT|nr:FecR domain-containing protein [Reichenbachiella carrageenanivorans]UXX79223.1 FecR domain-containing protein [Reichenbachiella carrageenanivorans]